MNKIKQIKNAIANTSPERLAKIEYQSHFMQIIGVTIVCGILIWKGFWWIILAFVFSIGVSVSQAISAHQKYTAIMSIVGDTYNYDKDKSPTRRRDHVIKNTLGFWSKPVSVFVSLVVCMRYVPYNTWYYKILFAVCLLTVYLVFYFFPIYWMAKFWFDRK